MTTGIEKAKPVHNELIMFVISTLSIIAICLHLSNISYLPTSKIEDGQVVERSDSVITVVIPDIR